MKFEEKGTLPLGVERGGELCRGYSVQPMRVKDSLALRKSPDMARATGDDHLLGLLSYSRRVSINGIPAEDMTLDFMLSLYEEDLDELMAADGRLKEQIARFRGEAAETNDTGAASSEDTVEESKSAGAESG